MRNSKTAVKAERVSFTATSTFIHCSKSALSTKATEKEKGLERKNKNTPQKFMPPAFCILNSKFAFPNRTSCSWANRGATCWVMSHQDTVSFPKGNSPHPA